VSGVTLPTMLILLRKCVFGEYFAVLSDYSADNVVPPLAQIPHPCSQTQAPTTFESIHGCNWPLF